MNKSVIFSIMAEGVLSRLSFGMIGLALPLYAEKIGMGIQEIGILLSFHFITEMSLKRWVSAKIDVIGLRAGLSIALFLRSTVGALLLFSLTSWHLFAIRALHGASESGREPAINALMASTGGIKKSGVIFGWYNSLRAAAGSLGKALASFLLILPLSGFTSIFCLSFIVSFICAVVVTVLLKNKIPASSAVDIPNSPAPKDEKHALVLPASPAPTMKMVSLYGILISASGSMLNLLFPLIALKYAGINEAALGTIYLAASVVVMVSGPFFGWLTDNLSGKAVMATRGVCNIASSLTIISYPSFAGMLVSAVLDDAGKAAFRSAWGSVLAKISVGNPSGRVATAGKLGLSENVGEVCGPIIGGLIWGLWGLPLVMVARIALAFSSEMVLAQIVKNEMSIRERKAE